MNQREMRAMMRPTTSDSMMSEMTSEPSSFDSFDSILIFEVQYV